MFRRDGASDVFVVYCYVQNQSLFGELHRCWSRCCCCGPMLRCTISCTSLRTIRRALWRFSSSAFVHNSTAKLPCAICGCCSLRSLVLCVFFDDDWRFCCLPLLAGGTGRQPMRGLSDRSRGTAGIYIPKYFVQNPER